MKLTDVEWFTSQGRFYLECRLDGKRALLNPQKATLNSLDVVVLDDAQPWVEALPDRVLPHPDAPEGEGIEISNAIHHPELAEEWRKLLRASERPGFWEATPEREFALLTPEEDE